MEHFLAFEVWGASLAAAGAIGWLIGEAQSNRSYHSHQTLDPAAPEVEDLDSIFTLSIPPKIASVKPAAAKNEDAPPMLSHEMQVRRSHVDLPAISALRAEAQQIRSREPVWNAPGLSEGLAEFMRNADQGSITVMEQYRRSIEELHLLNTSAGRTNAEEQFPHTDQQNRVQPSPLARDHCAASERRETGMIEIQTPSGNQAAPEVPPAPLRKYG